MLFNHPTNVGTRLKYLIFNINMIHQKGIYFMPNFNVYALIKPENCMEKNVLLIFENSILLIGSLSIKINTHIEDFSAKLEHM